MVLTTGGELVLVRRSPAKYDEERRYTVADSATWAVPVLLPDGLIVRDASGVMRLTAERSTGFGLQAEGAQTNETTIALAAVLALAQAPPLTKAEQFQDAARRGTPRR